MMELQPLDTSIIPMLANCSLIELPIFTACKNGKWETVFSELDDKAKDFAYFAQQNETDSNKTILHYVCALPEGNEDLTMEVIGKIVERIDRFEYDTCEWQEFVNLQTSDKQYTALHYAIENKNKQLVEFLMLHGADVNLRTIDGKKDALGLIYDRLHVVMVKLFDQGYTIVKDKYDPENELLWQIECDFTSISGIPNDCRKEDKSYQNAHFRETTLLAEVLQQQHIKRSRILEHPLVQIFLYHKGIKMRYFIWLSIIYHVLWSLLVSVYIACNFDELRESDGKIDTDENETTPEGILEIIVKEREKETCYWGPYVVYSADNGLSTYFYFYFILALWVITFAKECFEFKISPSVKFYLYQFENWGQIIVLAIVPVSTIITVIVQKNEAETGSEEAVLRHVSFILNTIGIGIALLLIQGQATKSEHLGIYNQMLVKVFLKFIKFFIAFLPKLAAFLVLFYRLIPQKKQQFHHEWGLGINKVLAMMTGELNYDDLFSSDEVESYIHWVPAKVVFFFFVVSVTIVLQNLLLGLTISDIDKLRKKALANHLAARLEVINLAEQILTNDRLISLLHRFGYKRLLKSLLVGNVIRDDNFDGNSQSFTVSMLTLPKKMRKFIAKTPTENTV